MGQAGQEFLIGRRVGAQRRYRLLNAWAKLLTQFGLTVNCIYLYIYRYICLPPPPSSASSTPRSKPPASPCAAVRSITWKASAPSALTRFCSNPTRPATTAANVFTPPDSPSWPFWTRPWIRTPPVAAPSIKSCAYYQALPHPPPIDSDTSAYCQARARWTCQELIDIRRALARGPAIHGDTLLAGHPGPALTQGHRRHLLQPPRHGRQPRTLPTLR